MKKTALDYTNEAIIRSNEIRAGSPLTPEEQLGELVMEYVQSGQDLDSPAWDELVTKWTNAQLDTIIGKDE